MEEVDYKSIGILLGFSALFVGGPLLFAGGMTIISMYMYINPT